MVVDYQNLSAFNISTSPKYEEINVVVGNELKLNFVYEYSTKELDIYTCDDIKSLVIIINLYENKYTDINIDIGDVIFDIVGDISNDVTDPLLLDVLIKHNENITKQIKKLNKKIAMYKKMNG